mmetsp:Transcript_45817/g.111563  ORF Transcript_45817/g.111563 Transcript_45817/m.111563 type:complete len:318 (-) Transcript_45817:1440-2393(-)
MPSEPQKLLLPPCIPELDEALVAIIVPQLRKPLQHKLELADVHVQAERPGLARHDPQIDHHVAVPHRVRCVVARIEAVLDALNHHILVAVDLLEALDELLHLPEDDHLPTHVHKPRHVPPVAPQHLLDGPVHALDLPPNDPVGDDAVTLCGLPLDEEGPGLLHRHEASIRHHRRSEVRGIGAEGEAAVRLQRPHAHFVQEEEVHPLSLRVELIERAHRGSTRCLARRWLKPVELPQVLLWHVLAHLVDQFFQLRHTAAVVLAVTCQDLVPSVAVQAFVVLDEPSCSDEAPVPQQGECEADGELDVSDAIGSQDDVLW